MRPRVVLTALAAFVALIAVGAAPASAAGDGVDGTVDALAEEGGSGGPGSPGSGCTYAAVDPGGTRSFGPGLTFLPGYEPGAAWESVTFGGVDTIAITTESMQRIYTMRTCGDDTTLIWALVATPENLALGAFDRLQRIVPFPDATFEPVDSTHGWLYVNVPTDFRLTTEWQSVTARAEAGAVWATATATPSILRLDPGDPNNPTPAECDGLAPIAPYDPTSPGNCSYTYLNSSATGPDGSNFTYEFTIVWTVTFDGSGGPDPLPPTTMDTTYTDQIQVAEARAAVQTSDS